jgi:hypothetical protein
MIIQMSDLGSVGGCRCAFDDGVSVKISLRSGEGSYDSGSWGLVEGLWLRRASSAVMGCPENSRVNRMKMFRYVWL